VAIWQHRKRVLGIFSPRMRRNSYLGTSGQKSDPAIRSQMNFHYRVTFTGYIRRFCATTSHDHFDLDLWPWNCFMYSASHVRPTYQFYYPTTIAYWVSSTEYLIISHIRYLKQSLCMRRVTWPLTGSKNSSHFWNPWSQFTYSLCHFHGATTSMKPCHRQK